jgi:hypothetical protein
LGIGSLNGGGGQNERLWVGTGFCGPADELPAGGFDSSFGPVFGFEAMTEDIELEGANCA